MSICPTMKWNEMRNGNTMWAAKGLINNHCKLCRNKNKWYRTWSGTPPRLTKYKLFEIAEVKSRKEAVSQQHAHPRAPEHWETDQKKDGLETIHSSRIISQIYDAIRTPLMEITSQFEDIEGVLSYPEHDKGTIYEFEQAYP